MLCANAKRNRSWARAVGVLALLCGSAAAQAGSLYRWETADGTVSYTDDERRIPERYRGSVETIERTALTDYERFTPTDAGAAAAQAERLQARLEHLRANEIDTAREVAPEHPRAETSVERRIETQQPRPLRRRNDDGSWRSNANASNDSPVRVAINPDPNSDEPIVVERRRILRPGTVLTRTVTVTRQGDRILSIEDNMRPPYNGLDDLDALDEELEAD